MRYAGDFHIHSHFSRATSKRLIPENLDLWGRMKGLSVIGTGDFTHPGWSSELREKLVPAEEGLFTLKDEYRLSGDTEVSGTFPYAPASRFLLTAEISSIYKYDGKVRKVHNVVCVPDFAAVERIQEKIERLGGNIRSDGRPILGLDSRDLLELCLEADENIFFVPAHIWTPWFSVLGSKSGFDSIEECFRDLSGHIFAVETGLSSDPPMNWMCSFLDGYTLISNSDAHSPDKLGREACLFDTGLSYTEIIRAFKEGASAGFRGTVEFFPQEGKYHFDGHRKCKISWDPLETLQHDGRCPVCGRPVTVGVLNRVAQLADRKDVTERPNRDPFYSLIPLKELLAELEGVGSASKRVYERYVACLNRLGSELDILLYRDPEEIARLEGERLAAAVERMRRRQVHVTAGYDGEYGSVHVWAGDDPPPIEREGSETPSLLFTDSADTKSSSPGTTESSRSGEKSEGEYSVQPRSLALVEFDLAGYQEQKRVRVAVGGEETAEVPSLQLSDSPDREDNGVRVDVTGRVDSQHGADLSREASQRASRESKGLNAEQQEAVDFTGGPSLILAGPGTGKTRTVVEKIRSLVQAGTEPGAVVGVTFANKAAGELRERLAAAGMPTESGGAGDLPGSDGGFLSRKGKVKIFTFHSLGLGILKSYLALFGWTGGFFIIDDDEKNSLLAAEGITSAGERKELIEHISRIKSGVLPVPEQDASDFRRFRGYQEMLQRRNCFDYDDLVYLPLRLFQKRPEIPEKLRRHMRHLVIDEYQDINPVQYALVRSLAEGLEICAVGDPDQSIYGFRGASPEFIERFSTDFPDARIFSLSRSYRCPDTVLKASGQVLGRTDSSLSGQRPGVKIAILKTPSAAFEAEQIARDIEIRTGGVGFFSFDSDVTESTDSGGAAFSDIAVLCRTSMQMAPLEKAFRDHRIPFRTIRTATLFEKEPYRSFLNFVRILLRKDREAEFPLAEVKNIDRAQMERLSLPAKRQETIALFVSLYFHEPEDSADKMEREISLYWKDREYAATFVEHARLGSGIDRYDARMQTVSLMTIHAAKGLEFDVVYIPGCEDSLIPCTISGEDKTDEEEERRLLYVAMTRAKRNLTLSCARTRVIFGKTRTQEESPFLLSIEKDLVSRREAEAGHKQKKVESQLSLFE